jgi:hypothetical protein
MSSSLALTTSLIATSCSTRVTASTWSGSSAEGLDGVRAGRHQRCDGSGVDVQRRARRIRRGQRPGDVEGVCRGAGVVEVSHSGRRSSTVWPGSRHGEHLHRGSGEVSTDEVSVVVIADLRQQRHVVAQSGQAEGDIRRATAGMGGRRAGERRNDVSDDLADHEMLTVLNWRRHGVPVHMGFRTSGPPDAGRVVSRTRSTVIGWATAPGAAWSAAGEGTPVGSG